VTSLDAAIAKFARRHHWPLEKAREEAARQINRSVDEALAGSSTSFDQLRELEPFARAIFKERLRRGDAGEGVEFYSGSTGLSLTGSRG
jgi:hypothetical protein